MNLKSLTELFLLNAFILNLLAVSISSYNLKSFTIKLIILILLCIAAALDYKITKPHIPEYFKKTNFKKMLYALTFLLFIFSISLIYSSNPAYGSLKILNFVIGTIPAVLAFYYLIIIKINYKMLLVTLLTEIILLITAVSILQPFSYDGGTPVTLTQWSHVIYGHFIAPVYLLFLLAFLNNKKRKYTYFLAAGLLISFYGTYLSGLKSAFYGIIIFTAFILFFYIFKKLLSIKNFTAIITAIVLSILFILIIHPSQEELSQRFNIFSPDFDDVSAAVRLNALKISSDIFIEHPVIGVGFGGFKNYNNNLLTNNINYPHNIFVEFAIELGITGLLIFIYILYLIFTSTQKISFNVTIFFCFALWFALFSKDISSNILLWLGLAFYGTNGLIAKR